MTATMLLQFNGYDISAVDFSDNYLDKDKVYIKWAAGMARIPIFPMPAIRKARKAVGDVLLR